VGTLSNSVTHLWSRAKQHAARTVSADAFLQSEKLQQQATLDVEQRIFTQLHAASSHRRQALLASLQAPGCSAWLTTLPTQRCYSMADESVRLGVRKRLGLLPFECLSTVRCSCRARTPFSSDPDHFHSCDYFKRTLLTQRHNNLVQVLMDTAINAGFTAIREPNSHIRPEGIAEQDPLSDRYNLHADLLLLRHDLKLYIDVTVTRPTCLSQCSRPYVRNIPLSSTRTPAANKRSKYTDISKANGYTLIPFVVESYGGLGPDATSLLKRLSHYSREYTPRAFLLHARKRLSVTLQSSNANIALMGMQETHLRMHARKPSGHVSYAQKRAANMGYPQPRDSDQLRARMGPAVFSSGAAAAASVAEEHGDEESDEARDGEFQHASRVNTAGLTIRLDVDSLQADTSTSCHPCIQHERSVVQSASAPTEGAGGGG